MKKSDIQILVVDDEESVRNSISAAISRAGFGALSAANADEARSLAQIKTISGAIVDCMLPMISGVDLALELKGALAKEAPLTLMSGIYKDRTFADDAMKKSGAIGFLHKPLDVDAYVKSLENLFSQKIEKPKEALHALLANPAASSRQRRKALDHVEEMLGYDIPFLLSLFMDAESSGHINLYTEEGELYGISIIKGKLCAVDCPNSEEVLKDLLVRLGFTDDVEVSAFVERHPGEDIVAGMVAQNLLSPHVKSLIYEEKMLRELDLMTKLENLKVSFAPDRKAILPDKYVEIEKMIPVLRDLIFKLIPLPFLKSFYAEWLQNPIEVGHKFSMLQSLSGYPEVSGLKDITEQMSRGEGSFDMETIIGKELVSEEWLYRAIHLMSSLRIIVFGKKVSKGLESEKIDKIKTMYESLKDADPYEVFEFFGCNATSKSEVETAYKDFARSNHPDKFLVQDDKEATELNEKLFALVTDAYHILTDSAKRQKYEEDQQKQQANDQLKAEGLFLAAEKLMTQSEYGPALTMFEEAFSLHDSDEHKLGLIWAKLKKFRERDPRKVQKRVGALLKSLDERKYRKDPFYLYVRGLYGKYTGHAEAAANDFSAVLDVDPNYLLARRELSTLRTTRKDKSVLTGDFSTIITDFFKPKK